MAAVRRGDSGSKAEPVQETAPAEPDVAAEQPPEPEATPIESTPEAAAPVQETAPAAEPTGEPSYAVAAGKCITSIKGLIDAGELVRPMDLFYGQVDLDVLVDAGVVVKSWG